MPRLKRVAERKEREREKGVKQTQASNAGKVLANKKWATKDPKKMKQYLDDLARARSKRKKKPNKFDREQKTLANIERMRNASAKKKKIKEEKKKDEEVRAMKITKQKKIKDKKKQKSKRVVANITQFDE